MSLVERGGARTKIIATIGNPKTTSKSKYGTHKYGVFDANRVQLLNVTIESLVELFIRNHVDLIRMNVAHHDTRVVVKDFLELKNAILRVERRLNKLALLGEQRVGVLVDLPGPKIRFQHEFRLPDEHLTVMFDEGKAAPEGSDDAMKLKEQVKDRSVTINLGERPFAKAAPNATRAILTEVRERLEQKNRGPLLAFIGDTECTLEVLQADASSLRCRVVHDGTKGIPLGDRKGFTIRGIKKPIEAFTTEDEEKLSRILTADAKDGDRVLTHVGISFCQTADDVRRVLNCVLRHSKARDIGEKLLQLPDLIAKIETEEGFENLESILDFADGVMVARGDLALEMETVQVPAAAKRIIRSANVRGKTVIMATQMLESMQQNLECSRPEAFDVFNAVLDGVDAVMLSGETSSGKYPPLATQKMRSLAAEAEQYMAQTDEAHRHVDRYYYEFTDPERRAQIEKRWDEMVVAYARRVDPNTKKVGPGQITQEEHQVIEQFLTMKRQRLNEQDSTDRITHSACTMAADGDVAGLVVPTKSGRTVRMLARYRPARLIYAVPHNAYIARKLSIVWGTTIAGIVKTPREMKVSELMDKSLEHFGDLAEKAVVFICGTPIGKVGASNILWRTVIEK